MKIKDYIQTKALSHITTDMTKQSDTKFGTIKIFDSVVDAFIKHYTEDNDSTKAEFLRDCLEDSIKRKLPHSMPDSRGK